MSGDNRKTLTINRTSMTMWKSPTPIEVIENKLKDSVKAIINEHWDTQAPSYNAQFRVISKLLRCLAAAKSELRVAFKFPNQANETFKTMCQNIQLFLAEENKEFEASFKVALNNYLQPKDSLPKVSLNMQNNSASFKPSFR